MIVASICYTVIGMTIGAFFALLFITFDKSWKKILSFLFGTGGTGGAIVWCADFFEISSQEMKFYTTTFMCLAIILSFVIMMFIMCKLIKDKDDNDILRIRDILLGQKSYIDKYYESRAKEIDTKLGIPILVKREKKVTEHEHILESRKQFIDEQMEELKELSDGKLKIKIPYDNDVVLSKSLLSAMPDYVSGFGKFIVDIRDVTEEFCSLSEGLSREDFLSYLISVSTYVIKDIFETNSDSIRVHFRYYDEESKKFHTLTVINGKEVFSRNLTPIPYEGSLIKKSYECKRALLKSANPHFYYEANNYTVWQDYMTYAFYGIKTNDIPILSFGISVKNSSIHKNRFYFLSFCNVEQYLEEALFKINEKYSIKNIIYKEK